MAKKKKKSSDKERKRNARHPVASNKLYDGANLKNANCPKCGPGVRMAVHKNRKACGKCGYTTFEKQN